MELSGQLHVPRALLPGKESQVFIRQETAWIPEPVWTTWRRQKLFPAGNQTLVTSPYPVAIRTPEVMTLIIDYNNSFTSEKGKCVLPRRGEWGTQGSKIEPEM
jgi:hypothetical protein